MKTNKTRVFFLSQLIGYDNVTMTIESARKSKKRKKILNFFAAMVLVVASCALFMYVIIRAPDVSLGYHTAEEMNEIWEKENFGNEQWHQHQLENDPVYLQDYNNRDNCDY